MSISINQVSNDQLPNQICRKNYNIKELKLLLPYYESDKWTNKLKNKILKLSNKYQSFYDKYLLTQKNMLNTLNVKSMQKSFNNKRDPLNNILQDFIQIGKNNKTNKLEENFLNKTNSNNFFLNKQKINTQKANMNKFYLNINLDNKNNKLQSNKRIKFFRVNDLKPNINKDFYIPRDRKQLSETKGVRKKQYLNFIKMKSENYFMKYYYNTNNNKI